MDSGNMPIGEETACLSRAMGGSVPSKAALAGRGGEAVQRERMTSQKRTVLANGRGAIAHGLYDRTKPAMSWESPVTEGLDQHTITQSSQITFDAHNGKHKRQMTRILHTHGHRAKRCTIDKGPAQHDGHV